MNKSYRQWFTKLKALNLPLTCEQRHLMFDAGLTPLEVKEFIS